MMKITHNGRPFDAKRFAKELNDKGLELGMQALEDKARGAAASIVDPETGKRADVFVDRVPDHGVVIRTTGSQEFARILEDRLGVDRGSVKVVGRSSGPPVIYLAHATEDKAMVRPLAEFLMANGIEVWFDEWEIEPGDSLRQKMEGGLSAMTHFVPVLTPISIVKPWVAKEIDVGLVRQVGGESKFVPVVIGVEHSDLPPFIQAMLYLRIDPAENRDRKELSDRIHGVSRKPALGDAPAYVKKVPEGLAGWSNAAVAIAKHLVTASEHALSHDPIVSAEDLTEATGLTQDDVRLGILDLKDAGYLWQQDPTGHVAAKAPLFVEFDPIFTDFDPQADALRLATEMIRADRAILPTANYAELLDWPPRRLNSAVCYLERVGAIETRQAMASAPWRAVQLIRSDRTLRFVRNHE